MKTGLAKWLQPKPTYKRSIELDFVRCIAILLAVGWHFNYTKTGILAVDILLSPGRLFGWAGVDLFFVLSGLLIGSLLFNEYKSSGQFAPQRFLVRRAFKIWPIFYLFLILELALRMHPWQTFLFQNAFHFQNYFKNPLLHMWSLAVEEQFYLVFAILFGVLANRLKRLDIMPWILLSICVIAPILRTIAVFCGAQPHEVQVQTQFRIDSLAFGVSLAYLRGFYAVIFNRLIKMKTSLFLVWFSGAVFLSNISSHGVFMCTIGYTFTYIFAAAFLLFCIDLKLIVNNNFVVRGMAALGTYSYALYIYQFFGVRIASLIIGRLHVSGAWQPIMLLILEYGAAIAIAVVITDVLEKPGLVVRDRLFPSTPRLLSPQSPEGNSAT